MAIVPMSGFSLIILKGDKDGLLQKLQRFGNVHFKSLAPGDNGYLKALPKEQTDSLVRRRDNIRQYIAEIEYFEKASRWQMTGRERREMLQRKFNTETMTFEELEERVKQIDTETLLKGMDESEAAAENTDATVSYIEPWQGTRLKDRALTEIRDSKPVVGTVAPELAEAFVQDVRTARQIFAITRQEDDGSVLFVLKPAQDQAENAEILAQKYHMKRRSAESVGIENELTALNVRMNKMISRRNRTDGSLEMLSARKQELEIYHEYVQNLILRESETQKFVQSETSIVMEGWIIAADKQAFEQVVQDACKEPYVLKIRDMDKQRDAAPVKLQNNKFTSAFESVTKMYATPGYNEVDPTPVFAPFYLMFFGMMLADIGYGLIMMVTMFLAMKLFNLRDSLSQFVRFLFYLSFATVLWGGIYGSFFGGMIPMRGLIDTTAEYNRVLIMAMAFGIIHLLMALGVKAYLCFRSRHPLAALFDVGFWYMVLISAIILVASGFMSEVTVNRDVLIIIMVAGMLGILLTNGRSAKTVPGKFASGLYSLYGLINYVSDIISYSRLMALGLAGGSIGIAINMMVRMVSQNGVIGVIIGSGIFIFAHLFNMFISGLSSYVHSSRLIYVEFFGKFYVGGGVNFSPFRAKNTYINVV